MEDGEGRRIDFKNCLIILTSNLGTDLIMNLCADEETMPDPVGMGEMVKPELLKHFKPAFLGRMKIVPYYPITDENMKLIVRLKLNRIVKRMKENREVEFVYDDAVVDAIAGRCTDVDSGARNADNIMTNTLLPEMSRELLSRQADGEQISRVTVTMDGEGFGYKID
jgi:type VI secretion system protein VasG